MVIANFVTQTHDSEDSFFQVAEYRYQDLNNELLTPLHLLESHADKNDYLVFYNYQKNSFVSQGINGSWALGAFQDRDLRGISSLRSKLNNPWMNFTAAGTSFGAIKKFIPQLDIAFAVSSGRNKFNSNEIFISIGNEDITFKYDMTPYSKLQVGFGPDTLIETKNKAINISEINSGDIIIDSAGNNVVVKNVIVTVVDKLFKVILIKKSKCGLNLPYSNIVMSIKNNLKIKKIILKGRNLFLNGKADVYKLSDNFPLYSIEIEGKKDYLLNGFIVESV